jgi:pantoate kinase
LTKGAEARVALAKRKAQDRVLKMEVESATSLAFDPGEANEFTQKVALMEDKLADACRARGMAEVNFQGLSNWIADVNRWQEDVER